MLSELHIIGGQLFVKYEQNAHSQLRRFTTEGETLGEIALPALGTVSYIAGEYASASAFYLFQSFTLPGTIYRFDLRTASTTMWDAVQTGLDTTQYQTQQVWFTSKDGTRVPMFLVMRNGLERNRHTPTLLTAYGGFNVSLTPEFAKTILPWLDHGGIFAVANLRGGDEFGEDWHRAGMLTNKQNVFDDFIAAAEYLINARLHRSRQTGHYRRQQRRPADGRVADPTPGLVPRRRLPGSACSTCCASNFRSEPVDTGVRLLRRSGTVRVAPCLLAVSSRE